MTEYFIIFILGGFCGAFVINKINSMVKSKTAPKRKQEVLFANGKEWIPKKSKRGKK